MTDNQSPITAKDAMMHADYAVESCLAWANHYHQRLWQLQEWLDAMQEQIDELKKEKKK